MSRTIMLDPAQSRALGIAEDISITLPDGWEHFTPAQRRQWCHAEIAREISRLEQDLITSLAGAPVPPVQRLAIFRPELAPSSHPSSGHLSERSDT